jgi:hypothetical protein
MTIAELSYQLRSLKKGTRSLLLPPGIHITEHLCALRCLSLFPEQEGVAVSPGFEPLSLCAKCCMELFTQVILCQLYGEPTRRCISAPSLQVRH